MTSPVGAAIIDVSCIFFSDRRGAGITIDEIDGEPLSKGFKIVREKDEYKALLGDGNARVSVGFDENIGAPYGYSSVKIRVNVSINCDQNRDTIQKATSMAFDECVACADDVIKKAYDVLVVHLGKLYPKE